jgi:hypothetical protein
MSWDIICSMVGRRRSGGPGAWLAAGLAGLLLTAGVGASLFAALLGAGRGSGCGAAAGGPATPGGQVVLGPPGTGQVVGATEFGGPGDPSSGVVGGSGVDLLAAPDSFAELGGTTFATATDLGGLPYGTPLRITWGGHSALAYKRDIGLGGGPVAGLPRVIDLWWQLAGGLGIPYTHGLWSGAVRIERPPATGAGHQLGQVLADQAPAGLPAPGAPGAAPGCVTAGGSGVALTAGPRATLLADGLAAAPAGAPASVKAMIAAGNQIVGKPYVYGAAHGQPLSTVAAAYDCSSSVDHLLYGGGLLPVTATVASGTLESFGRPGPGRWVTLYANAGHVFMYVAGLRWDTSDAAGPGDGGGGIGWHPLVRDATGFVARHPVGL